MKFNDAVFGAVLLALGAAVLTIVQGYPKIPGQQVGPALFPGLIAAGLCVGGLVLLVRGWRERKAVPWFTADDWLRSPRHVAGALVVIGSVLVYMLAAERIGFLPVAAALLFVNFITFRVRPLPAIGMALVATLLIHFAFYKLLRVPLPWGVLKNYAW